MEKYTEISYEVGNFDGSTQYHTRYGKSWLGVVMPAIVTDKPEVLCIQCIIFKGLRRRQT